MIILRSSLPSRLDPDAGPRPLLARVISDVMGFSIVLSGLVAMESTLAASMESGRAVDDIKKRTRAQWKEARSILGQIERDALHLVRCCNENISIDVGPCPSRLAAMGCLVAEHIRMLETHTLHRPIKSVLHMKDMAELCERASSALSCIGQSALFNAKQTPLSRIMASSAARRVVPRSTDVMPCPILEGSDHIIIGAAVSELPTSEECPVCTPTPKRRSKSCPVEIVVGEEETYSTPPARVSELKHEMDEWTTAAYRRNDHVLNSLDEGRRGILHKTPKIDINDMKPRDVLFCAIASLSVEAARYCAMAK